MRDRKPDSSPLVSGSEKTLAGENSDFDRMMEHGCMELSNKERKIPNPEYKQLTYCLKKAREKKSRIEAKVFQHLEDGRNNGK